MSRWIMPGIFVALGALTLALRHQGSVSDTASSVIMFVLLIAALALNIARGQRRRPSRDQH